MASESTQSEATILAVDDEVIYLLVLEDLLKDHYQVHIEASGQGALAYLEAGGKADLILLDIMMPDMDGFEVCRRIKADPQRQDVPILFLTGMEGSTDEEIGLSLGATDFMHKPFNPPVVLARIRNNLRCAMVFKQLHALGIEPSVVPGRG